MSTIERTDLHQMAEERAARARRLRERAHEVDDLPLLRMAVERRAAEHELIATVLSERAGRTRVAANSDSVRAAS